MTVVWSGTTEDGSFRAVESETSEEELTRHLDALRSVGKGYVEVRHPDAAHPVVTLGFTGDRAVVQVFRTADTMLVLVGDGSVPSEQLVSVPVMDEDAPFTGELVSSTDRAWSVVSAFMSGHDLEAEGEWRELA
jgi:hypothetical protein